MRSLIIYLQQNPLKFYVSFYAPFRTETPPGH